MQAVRAMAAREGLKPTALMRRWVEDGISVRGGSEPAKDDLQGLSAKVDQVLGLLGNVVVLDAVKARRGRQRRPRIRPKLEQPPGSQPTRQPLRGRTRRLLLPRKPPRSTRPPRRLRPRKQPPRRQPPRRELRRRELRRRQRLGQERRPGLAPGQLNDRSYKGVGPAGHLQPFGQPLTPLPAKANTGHSERGSCGASREPSRRPNGASVDGRDGQSGGLPLLPKLLPNQATQSDTRRRPTTPRPPGPASDLHKRRPAGIGQHAPTQRESDFLIRRLWVRAPRGPRFPWVRA
jgi:hypothetical protein